MSLPLDAGMRADPGSGGRTGNCSASDIGFRLPGKRSRPRRYRSGAHANDYVSRHRFSGNESPKAFAARYGFDAPVPVPLEARDERILVGAGNGILARAVDVRDRNNVRLVETGAKIVEQVRQPRDMI